MKLFKPGTAILFIGIFCILAAIYADVYLELSNSPIAYTAEEMSQIDVPLVNINTATLKELEASPEMTPYRAKNIIAYRDKHGSFSSLEELLNVEGIGKKIYSRIAIYLTVK